MTKMKKWISVLCAAVLAGCAVPLAACGNGEEGKVNKAPYEKIVNDKSKDIQYTVMFITNKSYIQAESYLKDFNRFYGETDPESDRMVGFGIPGPMLLNQSVQEIQQEVKGAFRLAKLYNRPVYFNLDDSTAYTDAFGGGADPKFYKDPGMSEWTSFPKMGESWGGSSNGALPRWWFNWGNWLHTSAVPCLNSESFLEFMTGQLNGFLSALTECYQELIDEGNEYLFAGVSVGWETQIPDYPSVLGDPNGVTSGSDKMLSYEYAQYGYHALYNLGYSDARLKKEADEKNITVKQLRQDLLMGVITDYIVYMAKSVYDAGIPREKIFSHTVSIASQPNAKRTTHYPDIECAINEYCIPGWTMNRNSCNYDMDNLLEKIDDFQPGYKEFANAEGYSRGLNGKLYDSYVNNTEYEKACEAYFEEMFRYKDSSGAVKGAARVVTVYGYDGETSMYGFTKSEDYGFVKATRKWLADEIVRDFDYSKFLSDMRAEMEA